MSELQNVQVIGEGFTVVIETNQYAGSFERELAAYCTGVTGEDEIGQDVANLFYRDLNIEDDEEDVADPKLAYEKSIFHGFLADRQDDNGVWRPCSIWPNPRYGCNSNGEYAVLDEENYEQYNFPAYLGVAIYFEVKPHQKHLDLIKERAIQFFNEVYPSLAEDKPIPVIERVRLLREVIGVEDLGEV